MQSNSILLDTVLLFQNEYPKTPADINIYSDLTFALLFTCSNSGQRKVHSKYRIAIYIEVSPRALYADVTFDNFCMRKGFAW